MSPISPQAGWSRRRFLTASFAGAGILVVPAAALAQSPGKLPMPAVADTAARATPKPPPLDGAIVKEFVAAAHGKLDRTCEMLGNEPGLLNATWDWKAGDFETAIGGAGHMGRRDIALFLIGEGARMDLFVAAMLGELAIVRAYLAAHPALAHSKGPHGISLTAHARAGGEAAAEVLAHLEALGSR